MKEGDPIQKSPSTGVNPVRDPINFQKLRMRWEELRKKYPLLDQLCDFLCGIRLNLIITTLRNRLLAGVLIAIPIIVTIWVLQIAFNFISTISLPWLIAVGFQAPRVVAFLVTLVILLGLGFMATNVIGARIIAGTERLMLKIPGVAPVFSATKQIIEAFKGMSGPTSFQRVVYIEYPSPGCRLIGFVTGQYFDPTSKKELTTVFLPTCPNPITGFVLAIDSENIVDAPFGLDEATKMLVSVGLVTPKGLTSHHHLEALGELGKLATPVANENAAKPSESAVGVSTIEIVKGQPPRLKSEQHGASTPLS